jgi:translation initiation factor IF-1
MSKKEKEQRLIVQGTVIETLRGTFFKVECNNQSILCTLSGKIQKNNIRILVGDRVQVELSPYDLGKGRIISRLDRQQSR